MKNLLHLLNRNKVFIIFLIISVFLLYIHKLGNRFTTEIDIPITIVSDYASELWVDNNNLLVTINCDADGRILALHKLGFTPTINIAASTLKFVASTKPNYYSIDLTSLKQAIQRRYNNLNINFISDNLSLLHLSRVVHKRVPIMSRLDVSYRSQHMLLDSIKLSDDSIDVKGSFLIIDTLQAVYTDVLTFDNVSRSLRGSVPLVLPFSTLSSYNSVDYNISVDVFTEVDFQLSLSVLGLPVNLSSIILPSEVSVRLRIPMSSYDLTSSPVATISYNGSSHLTNCLTKVSLSSLPFGSQVLFISPEYVDLFVGRK